MHSSRLLIALLATITLSGRSAASPTEQANVTSAAAHPQDHADIETLIGEQVSAWNRGDAAAFAARTLPDVVFTNVVGRFSVGHGPFLAQHEHIFATIYKGSHLTQKIANLVFVRPDVAIVDTVTSVAGYQALPPGATAYNGKLYSRLEQVMVRNGGTWWVAAFHNVAVNTSIPGLVPTEP